MFSALLQSTCAASTVALTTAEFARCRGSMFTLRASDGSVQEVVLADVLAYDRGPAIENFSLHFTGRADREKPQGLYQFTHPEGGRFDLFVVARRMDDGLIGYEAVINRLVA